MDLRTSYLGLTLPHPFMAGASPLAQRITLAFTYPAIVTVVAFAIVIFLLTYVVPQIVSVFASTKQKLPLLTTVMLFISDFVRHWGWLVLLVLAAACVGVATIVVRERDLAVEFDCAIKIGDGTVEVLQTV